MNEITRRGFLQGMLALAGLAATDLPLVVQPVHEILETVPDTAAGDTLDGPCVWYGDLRIPIFNMLFTAGHDAVQISEGRYTKGLFSWHASVYSREMIEEFPLLESRQIVMETCESDIAVEGMAYLTSYSTTQNTDGSMLFEYEFTGDEPLQMKIR